MEEVCQTHGKYVGRGLMARKEEARYHTEMFKVRHVNDAGVPFIPDMAGEVILPVDSPILDYSGNVRV